MKKHLLLLAAFLFVSVSSTFAQATVVEGKKIGSVLQNNKDPSAVFTSTISLNGISVDENGNVKIPALAKSKVKFVSKIDMNYIDDRVRFANRALEVTFEVKDLTSKLYLITNIAGIESVADCSKRLRAQNLVTKPVQVVIQNTSNLSSSEASWLPGTVQDKLKSNLQDYVNMVTVVDEKSERALLKLQEESESAIYDESSAIELGKLTAAKFAVFVKITRTSNGYILAADFTDLTTGEQLASVTSREYTKAEYLYGTTGAADDVTVKIADKLKIELSDLNRNLLKNGSSDFSTDDQLTLAKQNEANFRKQEINIDAEIAKLSTSTDLIAVQKRKKLEAQKALIAEKKQAEAKRLEELKALKEQELKDADADAMRSIELKTQRDKLAKEAALKAAEIRKSKMDKQGVLGLINIIEAKKKALLEIREQVEARSQEIYNQMVFDRDSAEYNIKYKPLGSSEKDENGKQTEQSKIRRQNQIRDSYINYTEKFFDDCERVKTATSVNALLAEIQNDQKSLSTVRTVSSLGDELKVSYGNFNGSKNGWTTYLSLYSDGVLIYTDTVISNYEAVTGKKKPTEKELEDYKISDIYDATIDMYTSLLTRGSPIVSTELDYNVIAESEDKPSTYKFNFINYRVVNTISGVTTQTTKLGTVIERTMTPAMDLQLTAGIVEKTKAQYDPKKYRIEVYMAKGQNLNQAKASVAKDDELVALGMVDIPGKNYMMLKTEVTQKLYASLMGKESKSNGYRFVHYEQDNLPVYAGINMYSAILFCNKLSVKYGRTPVYKVNNETDVSKWGLDPYNNAFSWSQKNTIQIDKNADGFRVPTIEEWQYCARAGENFKYSGSNNINEVAWYNDNASYKVHAVAQKKPNAFGLYDMTGNVFEYCWNEDPKAYKCYRCGGDARSFVSTDFYSQLEINVELKDKAEKVRLDDVPQGTMHYYGFRIVCNKTQQ